MFHAVSKENRDCRYIDCEVDNESKWKKNNDSSTVISCRLRTKQEKKNCQHRACEIDSEKDTHREEVALHLLFVKVPQIHVDLQLLLQNLILFLQEFILNVVFVAVTAAKLRLRHFRNPAPMFTNYTTSENPEALDQSNIPNGGVRERERRTHEKRDKRRERAELRNAQRLVLLMYSARKKIFCDARTCFSSSHVL